jgi:3-hydroxyacyl-CoA dehydrogenase
MTEPALDNGREIIQRSIARIAKQTHPASEADQATLVASVFDNITTTTDPAEAVKDVDMVVEAIVENLNIKKDLFKLLDKNAREECIFASNTSGLGISDIASSTSAARRRR